MSPKKRPQPQFADAKALRWYFSHSGVISEPLYTTFLKEDLGSYVMPLQLRYGTQEGVDVRFNGNWAAIEALRMLVAHIPEHPDHDDADLICDAVNAIARSMSQEGFALYEFLECTAPESPPLVALEEILPRRLFRVPFGYLQVVPRNAIPESMQGRWVFLPKRKVWKVDMPAILGGTRAYRKMLKGIGKLGTGMPSFIKPDSIESMNSGGFDFAIWHVAAKKHRASAAKSLGYEFRESDSKFRTEAYSVYRFLTFSWAKAVIREHIIEELNRLAASLGIDARIETVGLPSSSAIGDIRRDTLAGDIGFVRALELARI